MARAGAAVVLAFAVCCLLVAPAPARRPVDLPPRALHAIVDREAAAEPLLPKPAGGANCDEAAEQGTALAVPEEEPRQRSSLLCLVFRCGGEPAHAGSALVARGSSEEPLAGEAEAEAQEEEADDVKERPYETDSDSDSDSDSDDEGDDGILGWLWRLADRF
ncbi:hypothetical protein PAHAL_5G524500 [Panicum hallii]|jgi:hypothetical protein|uniref:Uncharacterized protein n=1 Tax=Panicum hallii TaxID=206008 RepID=A0A2T8IPB9_9POAL|nr:uncharacterized protein LOC112895382 [Panicum hallii]PVH39515.1 hypothetical protein PAHAL_5G524500 [Panicum hallii]